MSRRHTMFSLLAVLIGICAACLWPTDSPPAGGPGISIDPQALLDSTGLGAAGDNFTWQNHPNQNNGGLAEMRTGLASTGRAFVRWNQATIDSIVGTGSLVSARLDITLNSSTGWAGSGGQLSIHRVTKDWTELGSTANCAIDADTGNDQADCSGVTAWVLNNPSGAPWAAGPTDSLAVSNGQSGTISFDVTTDVQAFLDGAANYGWVVKPRNDAATGDVRFRSREATSPPVVVLTVSAPPGWPILTNGFPVLDTSRTVAAPSGNLIYRTDLTLRFKDGVSDSAKAVLLAAYGMSVVGVTPDGKFFVRIPDPGPSLDSLDAIVQRLNDEPAISSAATLNRTPLPAIRNSRIPGDDPSFQSRADWLSPTPYTWAMRAVRAPLAWGCETGTYGSTSPPRMGVFEQKHQPAHPEFASSTPAVWEPPDAPLPTTPYSPATVDSASQHGTAVDGLVAAQGDNGMGVAGMMWKTDLRLYSMLSSGNKPLPLPDNFFFLADTLVSHGIQVLSLSTDNVVDSTRSVPARQAQIRALAEDMKIQLLDRSPALLVVVAAGNNRFNGSDTAYLSFNRAQVMLGALLLIRGDPMYGDRIVVVAGSDQSNNLWVSGPNSGTNTFTGRTDVAAPAESVTVLDRWTGGPSVPLARASGTSVAAPMVAGLAAMLLTVQPLLSSAQVKQYIVDGAARDGRAASGIPILNAYESLKLAADGSGTPLCGNRLWVRGDSIMVQRGSGDELLAVATDAPQFLQTFHGGRRIDYWPPVEPRTLRWSAAGWVDGPLDVGDTVSTLTGATRSVGGRAHDLDSLAWVQQVDFCPLPIQATLFHSAADQFGNPTGPARAVASFTEFVPNYFGSDPSNEVGYSPAYGKAYVPVRQGCTFPQTALSLYEADLLTGQATQILSLPDAWGRIQVAVAEDGGEIAVNYATTSISGDCHIAFVPLTTYGKPARTVNLGPDADQCQFLKGAFPGIRASGPTPTGPVWSPWFAGTRGDPRW